MDLEIEYLGRSALRGVTLQSPDNQFPPKSFFFIGSNDSLVIPIGRQASSAPDQIHDSHALFRCAVVSRKHACLTLNRATNNVTIQDLSSHHGTYIRRPRKFSTPCPVDRPFDLREDDIVTLGKAVTDTTGDYVSPVTFQLKLHYQSSSPQKEHSSGKFGLGCLPDSASSSEIEYEDVSGDEDDRSSSMEISPRVAPKELPSSKMRSAEAFLDEIRRANRSSSPHESSNPLKEDAPSSSNHDIDELPHNQLALQSAFTASISAAVSLRSSPARSVCSRYQSPEENRPLSPARFSPLCSHSFDYSQEPFENHGASIHASGDELSASREKSPTPSEPEAIQSAAPLDSRPVTPRSQPSHVQDYSPKGRSVSPPNAPPLEASSSNESIVEEVDPQESPRPLAESRTSGLKLFFGFPNFGPITSPFVGSTSDKRCEPMETTGEELRQDIRSSIPGYIQEELDKKDFMSEPEIHEMIENRLATFHDVSILSNVAEIEGRLESLRDDVENRLVELRDHITIVDTRSNNASARYDLTAERVNEFSKRIVSLEESAETTEERGQAIAGLEADINGQTDRQEEGRRRIVQLEAASSNLTSRLDDIEMKVDTTPSSSLDVTTLNTQMATMKAEFMAQLAEREDRMRREIEESKMLVRQIKDNQDMMLSESAKRPREELEAETDSKRICLASPRQRAKSMIGNTLKGTLLTAVGGVGAWLALAFF